MTPLRSGARFYITGVSLLAVLGGGSLRANAQTILSDNLSNASYDTEAASGDSWVAACFGTDSSTYTLDSITLLLANSQAGTAELDLYSDGGLEPGSLVGTLASPSSYSTSLTDTTFTSSSITLAANTTYWAVLHATSGEFDWSYTIDNTGTGSGYQDQYSLSDDAGSTWFTYVTDPVQMQVAATSVSAVPDPSALSVFASGGSLGIGWLLRRRKAHSGSAS